jgi:hypothetical protein
MPDAHDDYDIYPEEYLDEAFDEENLTETCPSCGEDIYEDAVRCPYCGDYVTFSTRGYPWNRRPMWWVLLALLGIVATVLTLSGLSGFF